jgi:hypothetical protein
VLRACRRRVEAQRRVRAGAVGRLARPHCKGDADAPAFCACVGLDQVADTSQTTGLLGLFGELGEGGERLVLIEPGVGAWDCVELHP